MTGEDVRDRALLAAHLAGDREAFPALAARHVSRLYTTAVRLGGGDGSVTAVRDGLLTARQAVSRAGPAATDGPVLGLLQQAVARVSLDLARRRAAGAVPVPEQARGPAPAPASTVRSRPALPEALATLPVEQRAVLVLLEVSGLPAAQAGGLLGLSPAAVRHCAARATAHVAELLGALPPPVGTAALPARPRGVDGHDGHDPGLRGGAPAGARAVHLRRDDLTDVLAGGTRGASGPAGSTPSGAERARHLASCTRCSGALLELEQAGAAVRAALAQLPDPKPPPDLAADVDTALHDSALHDSARHDSALHDSARHAVDGPDPRPPPLGASRPSGVAAGARRRVPAPRRPPSVRSLLVLLVAVTAVVIGGLALLPRLHAPRPQADPRTVGRSSAPVGPVPTSSTGTDYLGGRDLVASLLPALLRGGAPAPAGDGTAPAPPSAAPSLPGTGPAAAPAPPTGALRPGAGLDRLRDPRGLAACLSGLRDPASAADPLALDYARYDGAPALLVVLASSGPGRKDLYVVGSDCTAGAAETLLFAQLPRPAAAPPSAASTASRTG